MPANHDEIRDLCILAAVAKDDELPFIIKKLRNALREHVADAGNRDTPPQKPRDNSKKSGT